MPKCQLKNSQSWKTGSFRFRRGWICHKRKPLLEFSWSQRQQVNSGNKIPFPKALCNLTFQLKHSSRSIFINLHKYVFKGHKTFWAHGVRAMGHFRVAMNLFMKARLWKLVLFACEWNYFHNKNFARSLALIMRFKATRKWPIKTIEWIKRSEWKIKLKFYVKSLSFL